MSGNSASAGAEVLPAPDLSAAAQAIVADIMAAGEEVRTLKGEKKDFSAALAKLQAAKAAFKAETGNDYAPPGAKKKGNKAAEKKAAKAAKKAAEKKAREEALKNSTFEPRYEAPDTSKLPADERGPPRQPERVAAAGEKFYATTAINYTNGKPHIGHAYEAVTADFISRYHRTYGRDVFFLTGSDEHGKKVQQSAEAAGVEPIEIANKYSEGFQALNRQLKISNDRYIRTTDPEHEKTAQMMFQLADDAGDIYLRNYEGWYDVREERFVPDNEAELSGFKDEHGRPFERHNEASYHFKMSRYQQQLIDHINANPEFIQPESQRNMILSRLQEPLQDLSASRPLSSLKWGIPLPKDPTHVMYVWFDALTNYISGVNYRNEDDPLRNKFWPCDVHIVGRDIMWFHCVIWPCMLMSAKIPLPRTIFGHGWVLAGNNEKMSKSIGNVVDPVAILERFPSDTFRQYLVEEATYGENMAFQLENMINRHNVQLADTLGNIVHRVCCLIRSIHGGEVPDCAATEPRPFDLNELRADVDAHVKAFRIREAAQAVWSATRAMNSWIYEVAPWKIKGEDRAAKCGPILRTAVEAIYILAHFFEPLIPDAVHDIEIKLNTRIGTIVGLRDTWDNLPAGTKIDPRGILFSKIDLEPPKAAAAAGGAAKPKPKPKPKAPAGPPADLFGGLHLVVGRINKIWPHPESEKLFCEEIDVGEAEPLSVASGLQPYYSAEQLEGKLVVIVRNLKAAKIAGFKSEGMVLCATTDAGTEILEPAAGSPVGERIVVEGVKMEEPLSTKQVKKQKALQKVLAKLLTGTDSTEALYDGKPLTTSAGTITVATLKGAPIQ